MQTQSLWCWQLAIASGVLGGAVMAQDPREAVSRALTSEAWPGGHLVGEAYSIPVSVLDEAPGNFDTSFEARGDCFKLSVRKVELQLLTDQNGYRDFDIAGMAGIRRACPGLSMKNGDIFNVYATSGAKYGAEWHGGLEASLAAFALTYPGYQLLSERGSA